ESGRSVMVDLPRELHMVPFPKSSPMHKFYPDGFGPAGNCLTTCYLNALYAELEEAPGREMYDGIYPEGTKHTASPGIQATMDAVSGATGLKVQFYVLLNMKGFSKLINALGGVTVTVDERLPIGGDEYGNGVEAYIEPGKQHLDGYHALWFARSRYGSATGDYARMERQRQLQAAILAQMNPSNVLLRFQEVAKAGKALVDTDIPESMLGRFVDLAAKAREHKPVSLNLVPPKVDPEYPDYSQIHKMVKRAVKKASPPPPEQQ
ncbi:MAG: LCP family protein, partial [Actinobacteria bacterium]|nr:LCP family protein [Actinomycetota bacterium]